MSKYIRVDSRNSKKTVYHTDRDCTRVDGNMRVVAQSEIEYHDLRLCTWCDPEIDNPNAQYEQDHSYRLALKKAAENNE